MCIRDSLYTEQEFQAEVKRLTGGRGVHAVYDSVGRDTFHPVSYTHLRAHETVLDLVCRLLLATKNTKYKGRDRTMGLF